MLEHIGKLSAKQVKLCARMKPLSKSKHFTHVLLLCSGVISDCTAGDRELQNSLRSSGTDHQEQQSENHHQAKHSVLVSTNQLKLNLFLKEHCPGRQLLSGKTNGLVLQLNRRSAETSAGGREIKAFCLQGNQSPSFSLMQPSKYMLKILFFTVFLERVFWCVPALAPLPHPRISPSWALLYYCLAILGEVLLCLPAVFLLTFPNICSMNQKQIE